MENRSDARQNLMQNIGEKETGAETKRLGVDSPHEGICSYGYVTQ